MQDSATILCSNPRNERTRCVKKALMGVLINHFSKLFSKNVECAKSQVDEEGFKSKTHRNAGKTYVTLLNVLMMTKHKVTKRTILAGTTSVGIKKLTQDMTTKMAVGK